LPPVLPNSILATAGWWRGGGPGLVLKTGGRRQCNLESGMDGRGTPAGPDPRGAATFPGQGAFAENSGNQARRWRPGVAPIRSHRPGRCGGPSPRSTERLAKFPVLGRSFFFGVEYPVATTKAEGDRIRLGTRLGNQSFWGLVINRCSGLRSGGAGQVARSVRRLY